MCELALGGCIMVAFGGCEFGYLAMGFAGVSLILLLCAVLLLSFLLDNSPGSPENLPGGGSTMAGTFARISASR